MSLPTEDEIRDMAEELHMLDRDGNYPREKRTQLAAAVMAMRDVPDVDEPEQLTTAEALSRFHDELAAEGYTGRDVFPAIIAAALPALIARDGLILADKPETTRICNSAGEVVREVENRTP